MLPPTGVMTLFMRTARTGLTRKTLPSCICSRLRAQDDKRRTDQRRPDRVVLGMPSCNVFARPSNPIQTIQIKTCRKAQFVLNLWTRNDQTASDPCLTTPNPKLPVVVGQRKMIGLTISFEGISPHTANTMWARPSRTSCRTAVHNPRNILILAKYPHSRTAVINILRQIRQRMKTANRVIPSLRR